MCGRYAFDPGEKFYDRFDISNRLDNLSKNYQASPGQIMPVINRQSSNLVSPMKWGFVPSWAVDSKIGVTMFNARAETVPVKPSFRQAFQLHRCLVPANGFYEWKLENGKKIPYYFEIKDRPLFAFAGLYDNNTYTIITTTPNDTVRPIHDRMPVILSQTDESTWLDQSTAPENLISLLRPSTENLLAGPAGVNI